MPALRSQKFWKLVQVIGFLLIVSGVVGTVIGGFHIATGGPLAFLGLALWFLGRFGAWWKRD